MEGTTQDDPAAMVIYAIAIIRFILMLVEIRMQDNNHTKTSAYADDLTVAGPIDQIRFGGIRYVDWVPNLDIFQKEASHR